jgi:hypothetical protein
MVMNRAEWVVFVCVVMVIANGCFSLFEHSNNGIYAEFMILWLLMAIVIRGIDDFQDVYDWIRKVADKLGVR